MTYYELVDRFKLVCRYLEGVYSLLYVGFGERRYCVFFFFFKQKTAYEIVSRDWSSDVCSSDLMIEAVLRLERGEVVMTTKPDRFPCDASSGWICGEIGRASCRERV